MASYGVCIGLLAAVVARLPVIEVTASEVKLAGCGQKNGTKEEMIEAMMAKYPDAPWPMQTIKGVTSVISSKAEHMADALGAIEAGIATSQFRSLVAMLRGSGAWSGA
jgi:Holliday junction resolvasome RuvABC endonuclease subunit